MSTVLSSNETFESPEAVTEGVKCLFIIDREERKSRESNEDIQVNFTYILGHFDILFCDSYGFVKEERMIGTSEEHKCQSQAGQ